MAKVLQYYIQSCAHLCVNPIMKFIYTLCECKCIIFIYICVSVKPYKCKRFGCVSVILTLDLHTIYMAIDTYTRNAGPNPVLHYLKIVLHPKCCVQAIILVALRTLNTRRKILQCSLCLLVLDICWGG